MCCAGLRLWNFGEAAVLASRVKIVEGLKDGLLHFLFWLTFESESLVAERFKDRILRGRYRYFGSTPCLCDGMVTLIYSCDTALPG